MRTTPHQLDITDETCPVTFVKTKLFIENLSIGDVAAIRLRQGEPLENVTRSLRDHGQEVLSSIAMDEGVFELTVKKRR